MTLAQALKEKKGDRSVYQFARELGVTWPTVDRLLKGRNVGIVVGRKIIARYPELKDLVLSEPTNGHADA